MPDTYPETYTKVAIFLHWLIGLLIIFMLGFGLLLDDIPNDYKFQAYQLHKSIGLTILALSFIRLFWRLTHRAPPLPVHMKPWEKFAAHASHYILYALMICIPLTGWALVSSSPMNFPTMWFGLFQWPHLPLEHTKELSDGFAETHQILAYLTIVLLCGHVGAALKHHFIDKDEVLIHMVPFLKKQEK